MQRGQRSIFNLTYSCNVLLITLKDQLNENKCTLAGFGRNVPRSVGERRNRETEGKLAEVAQSSSLLKFRKNIILCPTWRISFELLRIELNPPILRFEVIVYFKQNRRSFNVPSSSSRFRSSSSPLLSLFREMNDQTTNRRCLTCTVISNGPIGSTIADS